MFGKIITTDTKLTSFKWLVTFTALRPTEWEKKKPIFENVHFDT